MIDTLIVDDPDATLPASAPDLFKRLRAARKAKVFTNHMSAELMYACHRPLVALRLLEEPLAVIHITQTGLEWFIKEAKKTEVRPMIVISPGMARDARKKLNLDQATLAKAMGVSLRTVSHWEAHGVKAGPAVLVFLDIIRSDAMPWWVPIEDLHGRIIPRADNEGTHSAPPGTAQD